MGGSASSSLNNSASEEQCCTEIKVTKFSFSWTFKNFSFCQKKTGEFLQSSTFSTADNGNSKWCLKLYPNGDKIANLDFVSLFLILVASGNSEIVTKVTFCLLDHYKNKINIFKFEHIYKNKGEENGTSRYIQKNVSTGEFKKLLTEDKITVFCEVSVIDTECSVVKINSPIIEIPPSHLSEHLETLFESQELSDVVLFANGREFHCHKAILAARSPVFLAMLKHNMAEKGQNRVVIRDVDSDILEELLRFMYTGKAPAVEKRTADLLIAAEKYDIQRLKLMCEEALSCTLSVETAVELLKLADKYNADNLKGIIIQFIVTNAIAVMGTKEWENIVHQRPDLVIGISRSLDASKTPASTSKAS